MKFKSLLITALIEVNCYNFTPHKVRYSGEFDYKADGVYEINTDELSCGTGFAYKDKIITANHVIRSRGFISNESDTKELNILKRYETIDLLVADNPFNDNISYEVGNPVVGETVYIAGNSECKGINVRPEIVTDIHPLKNLGYDYEFTVKGDVRSGDSGSPVFAMRDNKPVLLGVLVSKRVDDKVKKDTVGTAVKITEIMEEK